MIYIFVLIDFVPTNNQNLLMTHCENWGCFWRVIETLICHTRTLWHFCCCLHKSRPTFGKHGSLTHDKNIHKRRPFSQCVVSWFQMLAGTKSIKMKRWIIHYKQYCLQVSYKELFYRLIFLHFSSLWVAGMTPKRKEIGEKLYCLKVQVGGKVLLLRTALKSPFCLWHQISGIIPTFCSHSQYFTRYNTTSFFPLLIISI